MNTMNDDCPCCSGNCYLSCCGRYLDGDEFPETAEQLMRSRYCAYVLARADYVLATWHTATRPPTLALDTIGQPQWLGLKVIRVDNDATTGRVEFVARYKVNGRAQRLHEVSQFVKENERWVYVSGKRVKH